MVCCTCWVVHSVWYLVVHTVRLPLRHFWVTVGEAGNLGSGRTSSTILFSFSSEFCGTWKGELATLIFPSGQMRTLTWKMRSRMAQLSKQIKIEMGPTFNPTHYPIFHYLICKTWKENQVPCWKMTEFNWNHDREIFFFGLDKWLHFEWFRDYDKIDVNQIDCLW